MFRSLSYSWLQAAPLFFLILMGTQTSASASSVPVVGTAQRLASGPTDFQMTVPRQPEQFPPADAQASPPLSAKQQRQYLKWNFEKIKRDADELAALAESLQEELSKSNQNVLSVKVLEKAERIERLAKKIKNAAKGY